MNIPASWNMIRSGQGFQLSVMNYPILGIGMIFTPGFVISCRLFSRLSYMARGSFSSRFTPYSCRVWILLWYLSHSFRESSPLLLNRDNIDIIDLIFSGGEYYNYMFHPIWYLSNLYLLKKVALTLSHLVQRLKARSRIFILETCPLHYRIDCFAGQN